MRDLPESLQMDIKLHMYEGMLLQVPEFRNPPEGFIHSLVPFLRPEIYMQGDYIFHESTTGREMYFIHTVCMSCACRFRKCFLAFEDVLL